MRRFIQFLSLLAVLLTSCGPSAEELALSEKEQKIQLEREQEVKRIEEDRLLRLKLFVDQADSLALSRQFKQAVSVMDSALTIATIESGSLNLKKADWLFELRLYNDAIVAYTEPIKSSVELSKASFGRAKCYVKIRETQLAVNDLKVAIGLGNAEASALHDKINPKLKRVAYYETLCCDGTTSDAKGRGACSHHGGVCNWKHAVYETYRKYE